MRETYYYLKARYLKLRYETVQETVFSLSASDIKYRLGKSHYTKRGSNSGKFPWHYQGLILPGEWDTIREPVETGMRYRAMDAHFNDGVPWEKTEYGKSVREAIEAGKKVKGFDRVENYFQSRHELYESLKQNGYDNSYGPLLVNIGRNGEFIDNNIKRHRTALCKLLDLDDIPVFVLVRHRKWQQLRKEVSTTNDVEKLSGEARAQLDHPDMSTLM